MLLIRRMEEKLSADSAAGVLPGAVHLYIGQEAVAAGVCMQLRETDWITSTHRGHGHFLGKGGDPKAMMAEIWGKKTGICKGMGGSMHVADLTKGILGANGIVGGGLAISVGAAFGEKLSGAGRVAVCFFGDGASNQGVFMECLNVSTLWELPLVFVCEHNHFSEFTRAEQVTAGNIVDRARAFRIHTAVVDGNDVEAVWKATGAAVALARGGEGPCFIEAETYRIKGHMEFEKELLAGGAYRNQQEIEEWRRARPDRPLGREAHSRPASPPPRSSRKSRRACDATVADAVTFSRTASPPIRSSCSISCSLARSPESGRRSISWRADATPRQSTTRCSRRWSAIPKVIVFGEDVELAIFGDTRGLLERFGRNRIRNTPICEATLTGMAVGAAAAGYRVVLHMMFSNFLYTGFDAIANQMAKLRLMTGGQLELPITIMSGYGGGRSNAAQHSDTPHSLLMNLGRRECRACRRRRRTRKAC